MCDEELVVLYGSNNTYYCKRQQFGFNSPEAKEAHEIIQALEKDAKNKIVDITSGPSEEIDRVLGFIDKEINGLQEKMQASLQKDVEMLEDKNYIILLNYINNLQKTRNEITEILNRRRKM